MGSISKHVQRLSKYTKCGHARQADLYRRIQDIVERDIAGDIIECGVWNGGASMMMMQSLLDKGVSDRDVYMYDTFAGMSKPNNFDYKIGDNDNPALYKWEANNKGDHVTWSYAPLEQVKENLRQVKYPNEKIHLIKGDVRETLGDHKEIAVLRLDVDFYEATKHILDNLLSNVKGYVIVDDYGTWHGAYKAAKEYNLKGEMVDHSCMVVKI